MSAPTLELLAAEIAHLRDLLVVEGLKAAIQINAAELHHEREMRCELAKRLDERDVAREKAISRALESQKALTDLALSASTRATEVAARVQEAHNVASNEWRGTLQDHARAQFPRTEAASLEKKIDAINKTLFTAVFASLLALTGWVVNFFMRWGL
jgi:hypothetical protein